MQVEMCFKTIPNGWEKARKQFVFVGFTMAVTFYIAPVPKGPFTGVAAGRGVRQWGAPQLLSFAGRASQE